MLEDVSLTEVSPDMKGVRYLRDIVRAKEQKDAEGLLWLYAKGVSSQDQFYTTSFKPVLNSTFALRVMAYNYSIPKKISRVNEKANSIIFRLEGDKRQDILLAFRIVELDDNGVKVVYRVLERRSVPKITFKIDD